MIPFMSESIYQNLVRSVDKSAPESVHLCDFPEYDSSLINEELESNMDKVLEIVVLGRAARNGSSRKNRQPLSVMYVKLDKTLDEFYTDIIKDELNIKKVVFTDEVDGFVTYQFKPQLKTLGPKYGKQLGEIRTALSELDGSAAKAQLDANGSLTLKLPSGEISLTADDLLIEAKQKEGFYTLSDRGITVAIDTVLTPELIQEGIVRELISKIQTMRKEAGFNVTDHIAVTLEGTPAVTEVAVHYKNDISGDTLTDSLDICVPAGYTKEWDINGENVKIGVQRI